MSEELEMNEEAYVDGAAAFEDVMTWYKDVQLPIQTTPSLNRMKAVTHALALKNVLKEPEIAQAFADLPERYFDHSILERFYPLALAVAYQGNVLSDQKAIASHAKLPAQLVERATEMRNNLYNLVNYYLSGDAVIAAKLASIKSHTGYIDMANDLARLASIIDEHNETLSRDPQHYTPTCANDARRMQQTILSTYSLNNMNQKENSALYNQLWLILYFYYNEICTTGNWLFRYSLTAERFTSLSVLLRNAKHNKQGNESDDATEEPASTEAPTAADIPSDADPA